MNTMLPNGLPNGLPNLPLAVNWTVALLSLLTGVVLGVVFALLKLPVPAPGVIEGAIGVVGTCIGGAVLGPWLREALGRWLGG
jgi:XapX domain-containing protein